MAMYIVGESVSIAIFNIFQYLSFEPILQDLLISGERKAKWDDHADYTWKLMTAILGSLNVAYCFKVYLNFKLSKHFKTFSFDLGF